MAAKNKAKGNQTDHDVKPPRVMARRVVLPENLGATNQATYCAHYD